MLAVIKLLNMLFERIQEFKDAKEAVTRNYILLSLKGYVDEKLIELYRAILLDQDENFNNKLQVIKNLSEFPDEVSFKIFSEAYKHNNDKDLKINILEALKKMKPEFTINFFINNLDEEIDDLRALIRAALSESINSEIASTLLNHLKKSANPTRIGLILQVFLENGNSSISGKVLDTIKIIEQPVQILILLFQLLRKYDPFTENKDRERTLLEIYSTAKTADNHIGFTTQIKEMEIYLQSLGVNVDPRKSGDGETFLNPKLKLYDKEDSFLLNNRKIFANRASLNALRILSKYKGEVIDTERYIELLDPDMESDHGSRALTTAISSLNSAIRKYYPQFIFENLIGKKYGKGYFMQKDVEIISDNSGC